MAKSKLTLLHVSPDPTAEWTDFLGVRATLERWGYLPPGGPRSAVPQLDINVGMAVTQPDNPMRAVLHHLADHPADLIVLATHPYEGRVRWRHQSVAEPIARRAGQMKFLAARCIDTGDEAPTNWPAGYLPNSGEFGDEVGAGGSPRWRGGWRAARRRAHQDHPLINRETSNR